MTLGIIFLLMWIGGLLFVFSLLKVSKRSDQLAEVQYRAYANSVIEERA